MSHVSGNPTVRVIALLPSKPHAVDLERRSCCVLVWALCATQAASKHATLDISTLCNATSWNRGDHEIGCVSKGGSDTDLAAGLLAEVLVVALHELALAVEVEALLQAPLVDNIQAYLHRVHQIQRQSRPKCWTAWISRRTSLCPSSSSRGQLPSNVQGSPLF